MVGTNLHKKYYRSHSNFSITPGNVILNAVKDLLKVALCLARRSFTAFRMTYFPGVIEKLLSSLLNIQQNNVANTMLHNCYTMSQSHIPYQGLNELGRTSLAADSESDSKEFDLPEGQK